MKIHHVCSVKGSEILSQLTVFEFPSLQWPVPSLFNVFAFFWSYWASRLKNTSCFLREYTPNDPLNALFVSESTVHREWRVLAMGSSVSASRVHLPSPRTLLHLSPSALLMLTDCPGSDFHLFCALPIFNLFLVVLDWMARISVFNYLWVIGDELEIVGSWFSFRWCLAELLACATVQHELPLSLMPYNWNMGTTTLDFPNAFCYFRLISWSSLHCELYRVNLWVKKQRHKEMTFISTGND